MTTFNDYAIVSENRLTPVPNTIDFEIAALMGCALTTAFGVINNNARLNIGESIAVFGIGGVGLNIVQGASLVSAYPVIAVDLYESKLRLAKEFGATHTINASNSDIKEEIYKIVGSTGVDAAVDNTGMVEVIEQAYEVTSAKGRTVLVGVPHIGEKIKIYSLPLHFEKKLLGSHGGESNPSVDIPRYVRLIESGRLKLNKIITHTFGLDDINTAIDKVKTGESGRCMIKI